MYKQIERLACLFSLATLGLFAQNTAGLGSITGTVQDASGAVVAAAKVLVENQQKGIRREIETTSSGAFSAPALVPASGYKVTVTKSGFAPYETNDITLQVGQIVDVKPILQVPTAVTQVEVSAEAPIVDTTKTDVSQVVDSTQIQDLPINGRRVDSFVLLTPAVVPDGTFGLLSFRGIAGGNAFLTDGNDTTEQYYNENAG